jgi:hypothetical protein
MASWNIYDQLNKITLGQVGTAGKGLLQGAADVMNRYGIGQPGGLSSFRSGGIQQRPVVNPEFMRPDSSGAGERARRFQEYRTGRNIPGASTDYSARLGQGAPAAERAYQSEASRVAQLTAQDPELQRYERARQLAAGPGATPQQVQSAEDIGMQMWAKANPTLAAKVKPGQAGYEAIQGTLAGNAARAGQGFNMAEQLVPTPQGFPTQIPAFPSGSGYSTGFDVETNLAPGAQTPPPYSGIKATSELSGAGATPLGTASTSSFGQPNVLDMEKFQKLLNMVRK